MLKLLRKNLLIIFSFFGTGAYFGLVIGATIGLIIGVPIAIWGSLSSALWSFAYGFFILLIGTVAGTLIGGVNGITLGIITAVFFGQITNTKAYTNIATSLITFVNIVLSLLIFIPVFQFYSATGQVSFQAIALVVTVGVLAGAYGGYRLSNWHIQSQQTKVVN
jgi:hypothetical protein